MSPAMRMKIVPLALGLCLAAGALSMSSPAAAAPAGNPGISDVIRNELVQDVQWRRYGHYGPRGRYWGHRYRGDAVAAGVIGGLALGAMLGAAASAPPPPPPAAYYEPDDGDDEWLAYCASKYRSFDPASGTYLGYDGLRHPCQ